MAVLGKPYLDVSFELQRNDTYQEGWSLAAADGTPFDLTDCTLEADVCRVAGDNAPIVTIAEQSSSNVTGLHVASPRTLGTWTMTLLGSEFAGVGSDQEVLKLSYDLRLVDGDGLSFVYARGTITITPECTS